MKLIKNGMYLKNGTELVETVSAAEAAAFGLEDAGKAKQGTMSYRILQAHNTSGDEKKLKIRFDKITSHDITFVGIIQTARASGLEEFPIPYILTNCHNSLCAVGGTINEDDHMFGLSCAKRYGGIYVPPHQAVIHQYAREMLAGCGNMILGSDSHTRYGALGTMAVGEGGGELAKQLLKKTYDINMPEVVAVYLTGEPARGVGPQDVALALIGETFGNGFVKNKVMEFVGPGVKNLSMDFRIGVDVMTTETTCLSSIWTTDGKTKEFLEIHGRGEAFKELAPEPLAYYDSVIELDLSTVKPMIAMPFHPSNTYTIEELKANLPDILHDTKERARVSLGDKVEFSLEDKVRDGRLYVDQGIIAGCAGGGFENICAAADILENCDIGNDRFTLSVYPASMPVYMELIRNGRAAKLMEAGAVIKTAFCGPCFGAGDTPANNAFSIRHSTRNFPNREGSKLQSGQISSVALMDARSIAATAANRGFLTGADEIDREYFPPAYHFDGNIYKKRVYDGFGKADKSAQLQFGPNIKDWPKMPALPENLLIKVVTRIDDPVTTTDELIPSGETSSYRSNPIGLAQFTLSRKDPAYVGRAKEVGAAETAREEGKDIASVNSEVAAVFKLIGGKMSDVTLANTGIGSAVCAVKPGDGSAREQAASCQKVLGGWCNFAKEYATKRYRSNLINWGMLPFVYEDGELPFKNGDYVLIKGIAKLTESGESRTTACVVCNEADTGTAAFTEYPLNLGELTPDEREIILAGCLINYYKD
jgi:aconitate hydratase